MTTTTMKEEEERTNKRMQADRTRRVAKWRPGDRAKKRESETNGRRQQKATMIA